MDFKEEILYFSLIPHYRLLVLIEAEHHSRQHSLKESHHLLSLTGWPGARHSRVAVTSMYNFDLSINMVHLCSDAACEHLSPKLSL